MTALHQNTRFTPAGSKAQQRASPKTIISQWNPHAAPNQCSRDRRWSVLTIVSRSSQRVSHLDDDPFGRYRSHAPPTKIPGNATWRVAACRLRTLWLLFACDRSRSRPSRDAQGAPTDTILVHSFLSLSPTTTTSRFVFHNLRGLECLTN